MFGYAAFSETPFAALPVTGEAYIVNILEALTAEDFLNSIRTHNTDITESISSITDLETLIAAFSSSISEDLTAADNATRYAIYSGSVTENLTLADIEAAVRIHNASATEPISVADVAQWFGFGTIDNTQDIVWVPIDNRQ